MSYKERCHTTLQRDWTYLASPTYIKVNESERQRQFQEEVKQVTITWLDPNKSNLLHYKIKLESLKATVLI